MNPQLVIVMIALAVGIGVAALVLVRRGRASREETPADVQPADEWPAADARTGWLEPAEQPEPVAEHAVEPVAEPAGVPPVAPASEPETGSLPEILIDPHVRIGKAARALEIISDDEVVKRYRTALGPSPIGPKERADDGKTPEGSYYVCAKNPAAAHGPELVLSYPGEPDADRGLAERLITPREHRAIVTTQRRMQPPPRLTKLGGGVVITGGGTATDWTDGSIALDDGDAAEVFSALPLGTPVEIVP